MPTYVPPNNEESEKAVLASVLIEPDSLSRVKSLIAPEDFYFEKHAQIYRAFLALEQSQTPVDFITLQNYFEINHKIGDVGGSAYLAALLNSNAMTINVESYARDVAALAMKRRVIQAAVKITDWSYNGADANTLLSRAHEELLKIPFRGQSQFQTASDVGLEFAEKTALWLNEPKEAWGLSTGLKSLDYALGGLEEESQYIVAARPGMGKTSLALGIANNAASRGEPVALFSLEMSAQQLFMRLVCMRGGFDSYDIKRGMIAGRKWTEADKDKLYDQIQFTRQLPLFINAKPAITSSEIRSLLAREMERWQFKLVIVDYLNLMGDGGENQNARVASASRGTKDLAKALRVPVMALHQLSRSVEGRTDKIPTLADLRDSGEVEQNADVVAFIYREDYYRKNEPAYQKNNRASIIIEKHRNGKTGKADLYFDDTRTRFADIQK